MTDLGKSVPAGKTKPPSEVRGSCVYVSEGPGTRDQYLLSFVQLSRVELFPWDRPF